MPSALFHIIGNTVFLRLADVASGLPPYEEQVMLSSMDSEEDATGYSQRSAYNIVYEELRLKLAEALKAGSKRLLATYLQTLLAYPDGCTRGETVFDPRSGDVIVQVPPLSEERLYPKEKALIDMVAAERMEGSRVLVYATHTGPRDITERMDDMLTRHGFRVAVMKADAVAPERREAWVADRVKQGIDVMICHPRLVQTGLDLIDFPTLIWYETDYSVYVMRQASRRSWRIGQTRPVKVVFMSYKNTLQADALKLVAKKMQSSLAVEGELPEDGLAAYGDDGDDLMMALARKIVSGDEEEDETVEAVFAQARDAEGASEEFLVDDGWKVVEVEPETVLVNGNGHHADGIGPTVELVLDTGHYANGNGHAPAPVNGNGHYDEAPEPQQNAVLLGGVHGRGAGQAQGPQPQGSARHPLDVRVGADCGTGAGERAGRRETLDRNTQGEVVATSAMASPCTTMRPFCLSGPASPGRIRSPLPMYAAPFCCLKPPQHSRIGPGRKNALRKGLLRWQRQSAGLPRRRVASATRYTIGTSAILLRQTIMASSSPSTWTAGTTPSPVASLPQRSVCVPDARTPMPGWCGWGIRRCAPSVAVPCGEPSDRGCGERLS